jgi:hypothetical protein
MIYLLTAIELPPGGSGTVHIYTQTIHRTTQSTTFVGRLSGIRTQSVQTKINVKLKLIVGTFLTVVTFFNPGVYACSHRLPARGI